MCRWHAVIRCREVGGGVVRPPRPPPPPRVRACSSLEPRHQTLPCRSSSGPLLTSHASRVTTPRSPQSLESGYASSVVTASPGQSPSVCEGVIKKRTTRRRRLLNKFSHLCYMTCSCVCDVNIDSVNIVNIHNIIYSLWRLVCYAQEGWFVISIKIPRYSLVSVGFCLAHLADNNMCWDDK